MRISESFDEDVRSLLMSEAWLANQPPMYDSHARTLIKCSILGTVSVCLHVLELVFDACRPSISGIAYVSLYYFHFELHVALNASLSPSLGCYATLASQGMHCIHKLQVNFV